MTEDAEEAATGGGDRADARSGDGSEARSGDGAETGNGDGAETGNGDGSEAGSGDPEAGEAGTPPTPGAADQVEGTFLVTEADDAAAVLHDVGTSRVHTLAENPGFAAGEVVDATLAPEPPLEVAWTVVSVADRREIPVERSPERPTTQARDLAADQGVGELTRRERAGEGEVHVLTVPEVETETAAADVLEDEATRARAARLGVDRVEVRAADGVLSVRYLP